MYKLYIYKANHFNKIQLKCYLEAYKEQRIGYHKEHESH